MTEEDELGPCCFCRLPQGEYCRECPARDFVMPDKLEDDEK